MFGNLNRVIFSFFFIVSLERDVRHRSVEVGAMKDRLDDSTLREIGDRKKFQKILDDYKELWEGYKVFVTFETISVFIYSSPIKFFVVIIIFLTIRRTTKNIRWP